MLVGRAGRAAGSSWSGRIGWARYEVSGMRRSVTGLSWDTAAAPHNAQASPVPDESAQSEPASAKLPPVLINRTYAEKLRLQTVELLRQRLVSQAVANVSDHLDDTSARSSSALPDQPDEAAITLGKIVELFAENGDRKAGTRVRWLIEKAERRRAIEADEQAKTADQAEAPDPAEAPDQVKPAQQSSWLPLCFHVPHEAERLYARVRNEMRSGTPQKAYELMRRWITKRSRTPRQMTPEASNAARRILCRAATVFKLHGQPSLGLDLFEILVTRAQNSWGIDEITMFVQTWSAARLARGRADQRRSTRSVNMDEARSLLAWGASKVDEPPNRDGLPAAEDAAGLLKVRHLILKSLLQLDEGSAIVAALRSWYPSFMEALGSWLHPQTSDDRAGPDAEGNINVPRLRAADVPPGVIISRLVESHVKGNDAATAELIVDYWAVAAENAGVQITKAPYVAFLRGLGPQEIQHMGTRQRMTMLYTWVDRLARLPDPPDTQLFVTLLDVRARQRISFPRNGKAVKQLADDSWLVGTWGDANIMFCTVLTPFLLTARWHFENAEPTPDQAQRPVTALVKQTQTPRPVWAFWPDHRVFVLLLQVLRSRLQLQNTYARNTLLGPHSAKTGELRRNDPGPHRRLFAQMLVIHRLMAAIAQPGNGELPDLSQDADHSIAEYAAVETDRTLRLALECFIDSSDFAGAAVVLSRFGQGYARITLHVHALVIKKIIAVAQRDDLQAPLEGITALLTNMDRPDGLRRTSKLNGPGVVARVLKSVGIKLTHGVGDFGGGPEVQKIGYLQRLLRSCEAHRDTTWWKSEQSRVEDFIADEVQKITGALAGPTYDPKTIGALHAMRLQHRLSLTDH